MHTPLLRATRGFLVALAFAAGATPAVAQAPAPAPQTRWYLAEGATGTFEEEILVGNPNSAPADIKITYLQPGGAVPVVQTFTMPATSRRTVKVNAVAGFASAPAVSAVVESLNGLDIVVERSMYWSGRRGGHNSTAVAAPATRWFLAEGSTGVFDTFVLIANSDADKAAEVQVTFLKQDGTSIEFPPITMPPSSRTNIWVNVEVPELKNKPFSTVVESTNSTPVFVERAMYFGPGWEGGHESAGVTAASASWFFGEGFTGSSPGLEFETFLLLANPGTTPAAATVTFLREGAPPIVNKYALLPTSRENVWIDLIPGLEAAPFSIRVESDQPIVAERAMYWGPTRTLWLDAHNTPGVTSSALAWAFAEGGEDGLDESGLDYDTYFLLANPSTSALTVRATFVREDGTGIVKQLDIPKESRFTLATAQYPELSNQRFAAFFESANNVPFVAERAMYWGQGYFGGHASTGTPWTGTVAGPLTPPPPLVGSVTPSIGPTTGGTAVTITGTNFRKGSLVTLGGAPATGVVVLNATTIRAVTPAGLPGAVDIAVTAANVTTTLSAGFTYLLTAPTIKGVAPATGPSTGGTTITITGTNLSTVNAVALDGVSATAVTVVDAGTVRAVTPPHAAGLVTVSVTTSSGSRVDAVGAFTYIRATAADNILAFGDSNTEGIMASNCRWVLLPTTQSVQCDFDTDGGYPIRLRNMLQVNYTAQTVTVNNGGCGGEFTGMASGSCAGGKQRLPGTLRAANDLVVIMEGINDLNAGVLYGTIVSNLRTMVQTAKSAGKRVMLGTVLPCVTVTIDGLPYTKCENTAVTELNRRLRIVAAEESVTLADFHESFLKPGINTASLFSEDGLHPNAAGYTRMADLVRNLIVPAYETISPIVP
jgi:lysophospholipase L1-like esterase